MALYVVMWYCRVREYVSTSVVGASSFPLTLLTLSTLFSLVRWPPAFCIGHFWPPLPTLFPLFPTDFPLKPTEVAESPVPPSPRLSLVVLQRRLSHTVSSCNSHLPGTSYYSPVSLALLALLTLLGILVKYVDSAWHLDHTFQAFTHSVAFHPVYLPYSTYPT